MDHSMCPECKGQVDLKSDNRYSPDSGANIFHATCYITLLKRERDQWKKRAEQHGCNTEEGDDDCG